jgi:maleate isomerase
MWRPDGAGWRARIGVLTPHIDTVPESEFQAMALPGVSIHAARVPLGIVGDGGTIIPQVGQELARSFSEAPHVDAAAALLAAAPLHAIVYAFTSSSYLLGADGDTALKVRLQKSTRSIPVVIATAAACTALRAVGARRIAIIHPPWFTPDLDRSGAAYFEHQGFEVVHHGPAPLRSDYGDVHAEKIYDWTRRNVPASAEVVFIGGSGFRAIGAVEALEEDLDIPVLTANQATFWHALRLAGVHASVSGYGRLFEHALSAQA